MSLAAIDTALWDLRCRRIGLPLWKAAGGAQPRVPVYTTEGGWLHHSAKRLVDEAVGGDVGVGHVTPLIAALLAQPSRASRAHPGSGFSPSYSET